MEFWGVLHKCQFHLKIHLKTNLFPIYPDPKNITLWDSLLLDSPPWTSHVTRAIKAKVLIFPG